MEWISTAAAAAMSLFSAAPPQTIVYGYVDADYARVAPREAGTLRELRVARGEPVAAGQMLFIVDPDNETAARDLAQAQLAQAESQLANLRKGRRTPEIEAIEAQRRQARAALELSEAQYKRFSALPVGQVVSQDRLDQA